MKILYHHRIASKDGQYVHIEEIINALEHLGHQIILVGPKIANNEKFGSDGGWISKLRKLLPNFFSELLEFTYSFFVFFKLAFAIIKHKPDAIYERYNLFLPAGIWIKKLFRLKLVLEVNSPLYDERVEYGGILLNKLAKWTESYTWRNADHLCPVTHVLATYLKDVGVQKENITVIPNGIDPKKFYWTVDNKRDDKFKNKLILGFVGFCREWHKLDEILELLAKYPKSNLMLLIIGDGPASELLRKKAMDLKIEQQLYITGIVERNSMPAWLDQIDIALQPSVTPWASPLKIIEYLAKGKIIIAPNSENIKELLCDNKNALLYDNEASNCVLHCIERILNDEKLRQQLQSAAMNTIQEKNLTWENNARCIESIFYSIHSKDVISINATK